MTSRQLIRWSALHEARARANAWTSPWVIAIMCGALLAGFVEWRCNTAGPVAGSHGWLAGALAAFGLAFLRVPFHIYWRADAALLAQLPIDNLPLFDASLVRCVRAAAATLLAILLGALPLGPDLFVRHAAYAGAFAAAAAFVLPAVVVWTAALVAGNGEAVVAVLRGTSEAATASARHGSAAAILGAVPGAASTIVITFMLVLQPWLTGGTPDLPVAIALPALAIAGGLLVFAARRLAGQSMGRILRDVSALDRQRLATLEIRPPTAIERAIARLLGDGALPYRKDARLMRRRYPMAYALGGLAFLVLAIVGFARPREPMPWLAGVLVAAALYGIALAGRLHRPPIELPRLAAALPITRAARVRAKLGWMVGWWLIFVALPGGFAIARTGQAGAGGVLAVATVIVIGASLR